MKVLEEKKWACEVMCPHCTSRLLVEEGDISHVCEKCGISHVCESFDEYYTSRYWFNCPVCASETKLPEGKIPPGIRTMVRARMEKRKDAE